MEEIGPYVTLNTGRDVAGLRDTIHILKSSVNHFAHDPIVRSMAHEIVAAVPSHDHTGEIAAVYHWLLTYVSFRKERNELIESPVKVIQKIQNGKPVGIDCDDYLVLAGSLLQALGHEVRFAIEGTVQPGIYEHIHLEVHDESAGQWYAFDPSLSNAPLGTPMQGLTSRWVESSKQGPVGYPPPAGEIDAELGNTHPCAIGLAPDDYPPGAIVHVGDRRWVRDGAKANGARYWRFAGMLTPGGNMPAEGKISIDIIDAAAVEGHPSNHALGQVRSKYGPVEWLEPELSTGQEPAGIHPTEMQPRSIDYSNVNQELYILMTQPDVNPRRLRRLFGFKRPPAEREKWWREYWRHADFQSSLPIEAQVTLGKDYIKVPQPGFVDGNSAAQAIEYFTQWAPETPRPSGVDHGEPGPAWADLVPDPDQLFGRDFGQGLWSNLATDLMQESINVQSLIDTGLVLTGRDLAPNLNGTQLALSVYVSPDAILSRVDKDQGPLGEPMSIGAIVAIIMGIASALGALTTAIVEVVSAAKEMAGPIVRLIAEIKSKSKKIGKAAGAAVRKAKEIRDALQGWIDDPVGSAEDWLGDFRADQVIAMNLSIARDMLDRFYEQVLKYGFSAKKAAGFLKIVEDLAKQEPIFYVVAKERVLRDLRKLKIGALEGMRNARESYELMLDDMRAAGGLVELWAKEYAELPFDADHIEIPGAPSPYPPTRLPDGNYPYTDADDPPENPFLDEDELEERFKEERATAVGAGYDWAGAQDFGWQGRDDRVSVAPGISVDVAPGAGGTNEVTVDPESGLIDVTRRGPATGFASEHPIITAAAVGGIGWGLWKLFTKYRGV